ncbi:hypothetical protein ACFQE1_09630, partial [Halobium palmae]
GDVAVYDSPAAPVERDGDAVVDADGNRWTVERDGLVSAEGDERLARVPGRHGLWFAFRSQYDDVSVVGEERAAG